MERTMITEVFNPIQLEDMDQVKLMNRTDTKYWFHASQLNRLLNLIKDDYFILQVADQNMQSYSSTYFDTSHDSMYLQHHNGKLNRYKVRRRSYISSGLNFLEIKIKNNKGKTKKRRIPTANAEGTFSRTERDFLRLNLPFEYTDLHPSLKNQFSRITLVNKNFQERCTLDLNLKFQWADRANALDNLAIAEIKSNGRALTSALVLALRDMRIKTSGFSKYCVGRSMLQPELKSNNFKSKLRRIEKAVQTIHTVTNLD